MPSRPRSPAAKVATPPPKPKAAPRRKQQPGPTPLLEWIAAGVGLVTVLAAVGLVGSEALRADPTPPAVVVHNLGVQQTDAGFVMQVRAANLGGSPAAQVVVEGELLRPGSAPETAEATFDFIPDHSARMGGLFFGSDPRGGEVRLRARGYAEP